MGLTHTLRGKTRKILPAFQFDLPNLMIPFSRMTNASTEKIHESSFAETLIQSFYQYLNRLERDSLHQRGRWASNSQEIVLEIQ
ncbi:MAG: hypothetical protein ACFFFH_18675 [Candidatus Thorarchaeota archaeon]